MSFELRVTPAARAAFVAAVDWYSARSERAARGFQRAFLAVQRTLRDVPLCWQEIAPGLRRGRIRGFPYSLIYSVLDGEVVVVGLVHDRRGPAAWRVRGPGGG